MKKKLTLILIAFISCFTFNISVYAKDPTLSQVTCNYNSSNQNLTIRYSYTPTAGVYLTVRTMDYTINSQKIYSYDMNSTGASSYPEAYKNLTKTLMILNDDKTQYIPINYTTQSYFMSHIDEAINSGKETPLCPTKFYIGKENDKYVFYACGKGENLNGNEIDYCPLTKKYAEQESTEIIELSLDNNTKVQTDSNYLNGNDSNATDTYVKIAEELEELEEQEKKYCDSNSSSYNKTTCNKVKEKIEEVKALKENVETQAGATGITKEELEKSYGDFKAKTNLEFNEASCNTLLGDTGNKDAPAYYLNFAFNLIKYIAIVLLLALTIIEYAKAVASSNQDAIKKATQTSIKRLIIAAVIFLLPILINFILRLLGIISTNGTCGIGI